jgi:hypothetical protein
MDEHSTLLQTFIKKFHNVVPSGQYCKIFTIVNYALVWSVTYDPTLRNSLQPTLQTSFQ